MTEILISEVKAVDGDSRIIKLREITIKRRLEKIDPISQPLMSSTHSDVFAISKCFDGDITSDNNFCHSNANDKNPTLTIKMGNKEYDIIIIHNRLSNGARIEGARISVLDSKTSEVLWSSTFDGVKPEYEFHPVGHMTWFATLSFWLEVLKIWVKPYVGDIVQHLF